AIAAFLFVTLAIASGLLWISELIEEHSKLAKVVGVRGIYAIISLHFVLYFTDGLSLPRILFSAFCHVVYLQNFSQTWPLISLTSLSFTASCILVIADHFLWFFYFASITHQARQSSMGKMRGPRGPTFGDMATFFAICVWLAPLFLFLSLSANDNALPTN
ncbi:transmembrane adaptor Erv26, partial [Vararia minispora EC-137]